MRLIDADALNARMYHDAFETDTDMQKWDSGCWIRYKMFEKAIAEAPTVEERKKGKWMRTGRENIFEAFEVECSVCHDTVMISHIEDEYYCRHCGADMRGEEDE